MDKYGQLTADLLAAVKGSEQMEQTEDGGTCNFDSPALVLPRWNLEKTEAAIRNAGLRSFIWDCFGKRKFVLSVPTSGQGNRRSRRAEAMQDSLKSAGYDASVYCQMD